MSSYLLNVNDNTKDRRCGASALRRTVALWLGLGDRVADDFRVTCGLFRFLLFFFSLSLSLCVFCCFFFLTNSLLSSLHPFSLLHPPHPTPPSRIYYILYSSILCVYYIAGIVEKDGGSVSLSLSSAPPSQPRNTSLLRQAVYAVHALLCDLCVVTRPRKTDCRQRMELEMQEKDRAILVRGIIRRPYNKSKYCWCFCTQHPFSPSLFSLTRATFVAIFCCSILVLFSCSCLAPLLFLFFPSWNFLLLLEFIFKNSSFIIWQRKMDAK